MGLKITDRISLSLVRIIACIFIFFCHAFATPGTPGILQNIPQFLNVGVPIFFVISGYLFSAKPKYKKIGTWYMKRGIKILVPYFLFLLALSFITVIYGDSVSWQLWLCNVIPISGITQAYLPGGGHLWYVTHILVCYLLIPVFYRFQHRMKTSRVIRLVVLVCYLLLLLGCSFFVPAILCTLLSSLLAFGLGFYYVKGIINCPVLSSGFVIGAIFVRLLGKVLFDGIPFYNLFIAPTTSLCLAVGIIGVIFGFVGWCSKRVNCNLNHVNTTLFQIGKFTYEFYLIHMLLLIGPYRINYQNLYVLNIGISFILTCFFAVILHVISIKLVKYLDQKIV